MTVTPFISPLYSHSSHLFIPIPLTFIPINFFLTHSSSQFQNSSYKYLQYISSYTTSFQQTILYKYISLSFPSFYLPINMAENQHQAQFGNIIFRSEDDNYQQEQFVRFQQRGVVSTRYPDLNCLQELGLLQGV